MGVEARNLGLGREWDWKEGRTEGMGLRLTC